MWARRAVTGGEPLWRVRYKSGEILPSVCPTGERENRRLPGTSQRAAVLQSSQSPMPLANGTVDQCIALETFSGAACFRAHLGRTSVKTKYHRVLYQRSKAAPLQSQRCVPHPASGPNATRRYTKTPKRSHAPPGSCSRVCFHKLVQRFPRGGGRYHFSERFRLNG
jgi:hypothetical protein